jgi:hypothetical protein
VKRYLKLPLQRQLEVQHRPAARVLEWTSPPRRRSRAALDVFTGYLDQLEKLIDGNK